MDLVDIKIALPKDTAETVTSLAEFAGLTPEQMIAAMLALYLCKKS